MSAGRLIPALNPMTQEKEREFCGARSFGWERTDWNHWNDWNDLNAVNQAAREWRQSSHE